MESVDVSVTSVEVVITDSKGNSVPGLTAADFEVRQDGIAQKITNFYAVTGGKLLLEDGTAIDLGAKEQATDVPEDVKAKYVFYVDNLNIQPMNRNRMFRRLKEFVPTVDRPERGRHGRHVQPVAESATPLHLGGQRHSRGHRGDRARDGRRHDDGRRVEGHARPHRRREDLGCRHQCGARVRAERPQRHGVHDRRHQADARQHGGAPGPQESALHVGGSPADRGPRALRGDPREVQRHDGHHAAVRLRHEHEVREDRPGRERQRRHDLHARCFGPHDRRRV